MRLARLPFGSLAALTAAGVSLALVACTAGPAKKNRSLPVDPGDDYYGEEPTSAALSPTEVDSGAFGIAERPADDDAGPLDDGGADDGGTVAKVYCVGDLAVGDLVVAELMIASRAGSSDDGEWVEVRSTRSCWLRLGGLVVASPRGGAPSNTVTAPDGFELEPGGSFVVADSPDPTKNHGITGKVLSWGASDVLKNDGDTITVALGTVTVDTLTYPALANLAPGRTLAFPSDCPLTARADWQRWSLSFDVWNPTFVGTPNATNDDVACY